MGFFFKKTKKNTENYLPISNLGSFIKDYENLLLHPFQKSQEKDNVNLTGSCQDGFKKNFISETTCLEIIKKTFKCYATLVRFDLTAVFDVVDRNLLTKHLKIMGKPVQLIHFLDD